MHLRYVLLILFSILILSGLKAQETKPFIKGRTPNIDTIIGKVSIKNKDWEEGGVFAGLNPEQEVRLLRTKNSKKFDLGDGTKQIIIGGPFHYKDDKGAWEDIDLNLESFIDSRFSTQCTKNTFGTKFSKQHTDGVEINYGSVILNFGINTQIYSGSWKPQSIIGEERHLINGRNLTYLNSFHGIHLEYELGPEALYHKLAFDNIDIFNGIDNANEFVSVSETLIIPEDAIISDSIGIISNDRPVFGWVHFIINGDTVFSFPPSKIWDSDYHEDVFNNSKPQIVRDNILSIKSRIEYLSNNSIRIISDIPLLWLISKNRKYPVFFDPTVIVKGSGSLTYSLSGGNPGYPIPWRTNYRVTFSQSIYDKSDIGYSGRITGLEYSQGVNNGLVNNNATVRMQLTNSTNFSSSSYITSGWSQFLSSASLNYTSGSGGNINCSSPSQGWKSLSSGTITAFDYNNCQNLLIETRFQNSSFSVSSGSCGGLGGQCCNGGSWYYYTPGSNKVLFEKCDNCTTTYYPSTSNLWQYAPIVRLTINTCTDCPSYDFSISPTNSFQTNSSSHSIGGCKTYKISVTNGNTYTFKTGCGNGATADYDTYLTLYDANCNILSSDDDGCESNRSIISWKANSNGIVYLKVKGYCAASGNYTLSYAYTSACTTPGPPASLSISSITQNNATFSWAAGSPSGSSNITYYWVVGTNSNVSYGSGVDQGSTNNTTVSTANLSCNTIYYLRVFAFTSCDNTSSNYSTSSSFKSSNCSPPTANFYANTQIINSGSTVYFYDISTNNPNSWEWLIAGGVPYVSYKKYSQNENFVLTNPGSYTVTLKVSNTAGSNTKTINGYIAVRTNPVKPVKPDPNYVIAKDYPNFPAADPIQIGTGTYKYTHTDHLMPAYNLELRFTRSYNSFNAFKNGPLGYGWRHSYQDSVRNLGDTAWDVSHPDGHISRFIPVYNSGGLSFPLYAGEFDSLVLNSGYYFLYHRDGSYHKFNSTGELIQITDANNQSITMNYTTGKLTQIYGPGYPSYSYKYINLYYDGSGRINRSQSVNGYNYTYVYDGSGDLIASVDPKKDSTKFEYSNHRMTKATTPIGNVIIENTYDGANRVKDQKDGNGKLTSIAYNSPTIGDATLTFPDNSKEEYHHDSSYRITRIKDALGLTTTIHYNFSNNPDTITNPKKQKIINEYDNIGRITKSILPGNRTVKVEYNKFGKPTKLTDPNSAPTQIYYDANGNTIQIVYADNSRNRIKYKTLNGQSGIVDYIINTKGDSTVFAYNSYGDPIGFQQNTGNVTTTKFTDGRVQSISDKNGNKHRIEYDSNLNLTKIIAPYGIVTKFNYDKDDKLISYTNARGFTYLTYYDAKGRLVANKGPTGNVDSFFYDVMDNLKVWKNALGQKTKYDYDLNKQLIKVSDFAGKVTLLYDSLGLVKKVSAPYNITSNFNYNNANQLQKITNALGKDVSLNYDNIGNITKLTKVFNGKNISVNYAFDTVYNLKQVVDVAGELTKYSYDSSGALIKVDDALRHIDSFIYGKDSRLKQYRDAEKNPITYQYDPGGNISKIIKPGGSISTVYDSLNRPVKVTLSTGDIYKYAWDANNNLIRLKKNSDSSVFEYDSLDRPVKYTDPNGNILNYRYDRLGHLIKLTAPGGYNVNYTYDSAGRMWKVQDWKNANPFEYTYDSLSRPIKLLYPNGSYWNKAYNMLGQVTSYKHYTKNGVMFYGQEFEYLDTNIRLKLWGDDGRKYIKTETRNYKYLNNNSIKTDGKRTFETDSSGNTILELIAKDTIKYSFAIDDNLTNIKRGSLHSQMRYDALGQRISKKIGSSETYYVQSPNGLMPMVLQTTTSVNIIRANYIYGIGLIEQIDSLGNILYYHCDASHNVIAVTNDLDSIKATYVYNAFGLILHKTGTINQPFKFMGEFGCESENDTLYFLRARYYNALTHRLLSPDAVYGEISDPLSLNHYVYGLNNPLIWFDPTGFSPSEDDGKLTQLKNGILAGIGSDLRAAISPAGIATLVGIGTLLAVPATSAPTAAILTMIGGIKTFFDIRDAISSAFNGDYYSLGESLGHLGLDILGSGLFKSLSGGARAVETIGAEAKAGKALGSGAEDVTSILQSHVTAASKRVDAQGDDAFTAKQLEAIQKNSNLRPMYRGNRIDVLARKSILTDTELPILKSNYSKGADFVDPVTGKWWDMTTKAQWNSHVNKYGIGGTLLDTHY
jgi:RHS repeat-associated protein